MHHPLKMPRIVQKSQLTRFWSIAGVIVLSSFSLFAQKNNPPSAAELAEVTSKGRFIFEYDTASWHSTDAVMAVNPKMEGIGRYVAKKTDNGWLVAYGKLAPTHDKFLVSFEATQGATPVEFTVKKNDPPTEDTGLYFLGARAIEKALADFLGEKRPYNAVVMPAESNQMYVYVLPAQTVTGVFPLGGDVRYLISADGSTIVEKRQLHKTILEFDSRKKTNAVGSYSTNILSDIPVETEVFFVLTSKPPGGHFIGTKGRVFLINPDGTIKIEK